MPQRERYLSIEAPDTDAVVDFLNHRAAVRLTIENGELRINVKASHGEDASTWDEHDFSVALPIDD